MIKKNKAEERAPNVQERLSQIHEPLRIEADDIRIVNLDVPISKATSLYPRTRLEISRQSARVLAHATDAAMREGWTYRGKPLETIDDFVGAVAERLAERQQTDGNK